VKKKKKLKTKEEEEAISNNRSPNINPNRAYLITNNKTKLSLTLWDHHHRQNNTATQTRITVSPSVYTGEHVNAAIASNHHHGRHMDQVWYFEPFQREERDLLSFVIRSARSERLLEIDDASLGDGAHVVEAVEKTKGDEGDGQVDDDEGTTAKKFQDHQLWVIDVIEEVSSNEEEGERKGVKVESGGKAFLGMIRATHSWKVLVCPERLGESVYQSKPILDDIDSNDDKNNAHGEMNAFSGRNYWIIEEVPSSPDVDEGRDKSPTFVDGRGIRGQMGWKNHFVWSNVGFFVLVVMTVILAVVTVVLFSFLLVKSS